MSDGDVGVVDHLLHRMWWQGNNYNDIAFLKVIKELLDRIA